MNTWGGDGILINQLINVFIKIEDDERLLEKCSYIMGRKVEFELRGRLFDRTEVINQLYDLLIRVDK